MNDTEHQSRGHLSPQKEPQSRTFGLERQLEYLQLVPTFEAHKAQKEWIWCKVNLKRLCFHFSTVPRPPGTRARVGDTMAGPKGRKIMKDMMYMANHTGEGQLFQPRQLIFVTCSFLKRNCKFKSNVIRSLFVLCQKVWWFYLMF